MRASLIDQSGLVVNVVVVGDGYTPPDGLTLGPDGGQVGWTWSGSEWLKSPAPEPPPLTAEDVRAEAQRRIMVLVGATSLDTCIIKQLNAQMRATELTLALAAGGAWTGEQAAEAAALQSMADQIKAIREASNRMEPAPPKDFNDDKHWPVIK